MTEVLSGSDHLLDEYMDALDHYGHARAEMDAAESGSNGISADVVEDRVEKARWEYVEARQKYRRRKLQDQAKAFTEVAT